MRRKKRFSDAEWTELIPIDDQRRCLMKDSHLAKKCGVDRQTVAAARKRLCIGSFRDRMRAGRGARSDVVCITISERELAAVANSRAPRGMSRSDFMSRVAAHPYAALLLEPGAEGVVVNHTSYAPSDGEDAR